MGSLLRTTPRVAAAAIAAALLVVAPTFAQDFVLEDATFDSWMLSSAGVNNSRGYRRYLEDQADLQIARADQAADLSDDQRQKLRLAAHGDTAQFIEQVEELRAKLVGQSFPGNNVNEAFQQIQPLGSRIGSGFYGPDSLLQKVLRQILTPEQREALDADEARRRRQRHEAATSMFILSLQHTTPMTNDQRQAFRKLLLDNSQPPLKKSDYDRYLMMYYSAALPEGELAAILDEAQLASLAPLLRNGRGYKSMLEQQGVIETDD